MPRPRRVHLINQMPEKYPKRKNIRLSYYGYTTPGAYLVTICSHNRKCIFGKIEEGKVQLNEIGNMVKTCWQEIPKHFKEVRLDEYVVMPNHLHGILIILDETGEACLAPTSEPAKSKKKTLGAVVGSFKSSVTRRVRISGFIRGKAIWQRGYYEHVVRNIVDLEDIREYIANNPARWSNDSQFTGC